MKSYRPIGHAADSGMAVTGSSQEELFAAAVEGIADFIKHDSMHHLEKSTQRSQIIERSIRVAGHDVTTLLVDFLNEILTLTYNERTVFPKVEFEEITDRELKAKLFGYKIFDFDKDLKAVTHHRAKIMRGGHNVLETIISFVKSP